jgi:hypothetical protein
VEEEVHEDPMAERTHGDDPLVAEVPEDPLVEQVPGETGAAGNGAGAGREPGDGRKTGDRQRPGAGQEHHAQLAGADERERFVACWQEIQAGFVDEPRKAVLDADALVADLVQRLAQLIASEREQFESLSDTGGGASTEELRQGLRRYRSLFERLLAV